MRFLRWVVLCACAELFGILIAAAWYGGVNVWIGEPVAIPARIGVWVLMTLAAVPEGVVLGGLQAIGLRWFIADVSFVRWIWATILVGLIGWGIGTFLPLFVFTEPSVLPDMEPMLASTALFAASFGVVIGTVFGLFQAWVLPVNTKHKSIWVISNAIGWTVALPMIYIAAQIGADYSGWAARLAMWAAGGCAAGATLGVATGCGLTILEAGRRRELIQAIHQ